MSASLTFGVTPADVIPRGGRRIAYASAAAYQGERGAMGEFLQALTSLGISQKAFLGYLQYVSLGTAGRILEYLDTALEEDFTPERIYFHLELLRSVPSEKYGALRLLIDETRRQQLTETSLEFLKQTRLEWALHRAMLGDAGLEQSADFEYREVKEAFLASAIRFLEFSQKLLSEDPNLVVVLDAVNRFGSLRSYYEKHETPATTLRKLREAGFDATYLATETREVWSLGANQIAAADSSSWIRRLQTILERVLGKEHKPPDVNLGVDRNKFSHEIAADLESVFSRKDRVAGKSIVARLLPVVESRRNAAARRRQRVLETKLSAIEHQLLGIRRVLTAKKEPRSEGVPGLVARRSPKLVPELLFDDARFDSWLFKPDGYFHGEICRLLLDPSTPILQFERQGHPAAVGLAMLHAGRNARYERTILVDTFEYDETLAEDFEPEKIVRFVLDAIVADAANAGAQKVAIFAGPVGRASDFTGLLLTMATGLAGFAHHRSYFFEAIDPLDGALANSVTGNHHYTQSFGYLAPRSGVIEHGNNLVTEAGVLSNPETPSGVFEIDVRAYTGGEGPQAETAMAAEGTPPEGTSPESGGAISEQASELQQRERRTLQRGQDELRAIDPGLVLDLVLPNQPLPEDLPRVHAESFPDQAPLDSEHYRRRTTQKDAALLYVRENGDSVGFALGYADPLSPQSALYFDEIAIVPRFQHRGIGSVLVRVLSRLAAIRGYREVYLLTRYGGGADGLIGYYGRFGFEYLGPYHHLGYAMRKFLGLHAPEWHGDIDAEIRRLEERLRGKVADPKVAFYSASNEELVAIIQRLQTVFPEDMRYGEAVFRERMSQPDGWVMIVHDGEQPIACVVCSQDPVLPRHALFADSLSVAPEYQKKGIGSVFLPSILAISGLTCYTTLAFYCREFNHDGVNLVEYYKRFGGIVLERGSDRVRMMIPIVQSDSATASASSQEGSAG